MLSFTASWFWLAPNNGIRQCRRPPATGPTDPVLTTDSK
jgi:hypothetical protein